MIREATLADLERIAAWIERDFEGVDAERLKSGLSVILHDPMHVALIEGDGGALFIWQGPGIYQVHVLFAQRGREVIALSHQMLAYMRERHRAELFWAGVPWDTSKQSRKVRLFTRLMGWRSKGRANLASGLNELFISE